MHIILYFCVLSSISAIENLRRSLSGSLYNKYGEYEISIYELLMSSLEQYKNDKFLEYNIWESGGRVGEFSSLYDKLGPSIGMLLSWESNNEMHTSYLERLRDSKNLFNRSMLMKWPASKVYPWIYESMTSDFDIDIIYERKMKERCPSFIKILDGNSIFTIIQSKAILSECKPILYVENDCLPYSITILNILESIGYNLYWHISSAVRRRDNVNHVPFESFESYLDENEFFIGILALPINENVNINDLVEKYQLIPHEIGLNYIEQYQLYIQEHETLDFKVVRGQNTSKVYKRLAQGSDARYCGWHVSGTMTDGHLVDPSLNVTDEISHLEFACGETFTAQFDVYSFLIHERDDERRASEGKWSFEGNTVAVKLPISTMNFLYRYPPCAFVDASSRSEIFQNSLHWWRTDVNVRCQWLLDTDNRRLFTRRCVDYVMSVLKLKMENVIFKNMLLSKGNIYNHDKGILSNLDDDVISDSKIGRQNFQFSFDFSVDKFNDPLNIHKNGRVCGEPVWCDHTQHFLKRVIDFQNPSEYRMTNPESDNPDATTFELFDVINHYRAFGRDQACKEKKFLVYEVPAAQRGIGSLFHLYAVMLRFALCHGRILYIQPMNTSIAENRWLHPGCNGDVMSCYFNPITNCILTEEEIATAPVVPSGLALDTYPWTPLRVVKFNGLPADGKCSLCGDRWEGDKSLFNGLYLGELGFMVEFRKDGTLDTSKVDWQRKKYKDMWHIRPMMSDVKLPWQAVMIRYMLRPQNWVKDSIKAIVSNRLVSAQGTGEPLPKINEDTEEEIVDEHGNVLPSERKDINGSSMKQLKSSQLIRYANGSIPGPYVSLHVRFGNKVAEQELKPLENYMNMIARKYPLVNNIFVSTETEDIIAVLVEAYPMYRFYFLDYTRTETLKLDHNMKDPTMDYAYEMLFSLANLYVAVEAYGFVGTLTSNWCYLIMELERTRGDGGSDYNSVDLGSSMSVCF